jgi:hypothetical protein
MVYTSIVTKASPKLKCPKTLCTRLSTNKKIKKNFAAKLTSLSLPSQQKKLLKNIAEVAHLVEHDLAKVGVAGSSPVFRSASIPPKRDFFFFHLGGGTGRHAGLKILFPATGVTVRFRSQVLVKAIHSFVESLFLCPGNSFHGNSPCLRGTVRQGCHSLSRL